MAAWNNNNDDDDDAPLPGIDDANVDVESSSGGTVVAVCCGLMGGEEAAAAVGASIVPNANGTLAQISSAICCAIIFAYTPRQYHAASCVGPR